MLSDGKIRAWISESGGFSQESASTSFEPVCGSQREPETSQPGTSRKDNISFLVNGIEYSDESTVSSHEPIRFAAVVEDQDSSELGSDPLGPRAYDFPIRNQLLNHDEPPEPTRSGGSVVPPLANNNLPTLPAIRSTPSSTTSEPVSTPLDNNGWGNFDKNGIDSAWDHDPWGVGENNEANWDWGGYEEEPEKEMEDGPARDEAGDEVLEASWDLLQQEAVELLPSWSQVLTWLIQVLALLLSFTLRYLRQARKSLEESSAHNDSAVSPAASSPLQTHSHSPSSHDVSSQSRVHVGMEPHESSVREIIGERRVLYALRESNSTIPPSLGSRQSDWHREHPLLLDEDGRDTIGTELADALEFVPRTHVYTIFSRILGNPSSQQHARLALTTKTHETFLFFLRLPAPAIAAT